MVHRNILVNGMPCAYSEICIMISEQVADVRYFSLEVPFQPFIWFLQKRYRKHIPLRQFTCREEEYFPISLSNAI
jgi:hypothetical protein